MIPLGQPRRKFLGGVLVALGPMMLLAEKVCPQIPGSDPTSEHEPKAADGGNPYPVGARKTALDENEKDIKKKVGKLFQLASELKDEVEKTDSAKVLSLAMVKKAEEIEKLAKDIKTRAKG
jgi:hypothetical protein